MYTEMIGHERGHQNIVEVRYLSFDNFSKQSSELVEIDGQGDFF